MTLITWFGTKSALTRWGTNCCFVKAFEVYIGRWSVRRELWWEHMIRHGELICCGFLSLNLLSFQVVSPLEYVMVQYGCSVLRVSERWLMYRQCYLQLTLRVNRSFNRMRRPLLLSNASMFVWDKNDGIHKDTQSLFVVHCPSFAKSKYMYA